MFAITPNIDKGDEVDGAVHVSAEYVIEPNDPFAYYFKLFSLFLASNLWTFFMTAIPVVAILEPTNMYDRHDDWYSGNDVARFLEPIGGFLFNLYIFIHSGILSGSYGHRHKEIIIFIFFLGSAIYGQGAGFHSASNMFKHALESVQEVHNDDLTRDFYYWIRVVWEHEVSHYLYASGYALMALAQLLAFRHHSLSDSRVIDFRCKLVLTLAVIFYGLLIAGVAVDFPAGVVVGLIYTVLYGIVGIGYYIYYLYTAGARDVLQFGRRPVLNYFWLSYLLAFGLIILWIIIAGGVEDRNGNGL